MKFLILLLFSITAVSTVGAVWSKISFPAKVLEPDLQAIRNYYRKGNKDLIAYIHWPKSVTFRVRWVDDVLLKEAYLQIDGNFRYKKMVFITEAIDAMYYKNNEFFYRKANSNFMEQWPPNKKIYYTEPVIIETKPYLSIRYFSLEDIEQRADLIYSSNKLHFQTVLGKHPATFMATLPEYDGHFLEYTYLWEESGPKGQDLTVRVLTGTGKGTKLKLKGSVQAPYLIFNENKHIFTVLKSFPLPAKPLKSVFGVRMENTAFLAEVHRYDTRLFSDKDLANGFEITKKHYISKEELLEKASTVEPRLAYGIANFAPKDLPSGIMFQVKGIIFKKSVNKSDGIINKNCPLVIELDGKQNILYEDFVDRLCTDDYRLWAEKN